MNKQGPNGIEYCDYTWNPVTGCLHKCWYCWARRMAKRRGDDFSPKFYSERLVEPGRKAGPVLRDRENRIFKGWTDSELSDPLRIFVCDMGDLFGDWVDTDWIAQILRACEKANWHTYQFLTKNPERLAETTRHSFEWPENSWIGTSLDMAFGGVQRRIYHLLTATDIFYSSARPLCFVSLEPLLGDISKLDFSGIDLLIVGAMTDPGAIKPERNWIESVIATGHPNILWKRNIKGYLKEYGLEIK